MARPRRFALSAIVAVVLLAAATTVRAGEPLKAGDRVVIYGDSITEQRLYSRYLQQFVYCRYPGVDIRFYNAGWGGDRAPGALNRLERDVLVHNPTVVTLFFGMNDGGYKPVEDATLKAYHNGMEGIIKKLQERNVRVIVFTPGCVDTDRKPALGTADYNQTLQALGEVGRELAQQYNCEFVDVHSPMLSFQNSQKQKQSGFTMIPDAVHPDAKGQLVMARTMLTAFAEPVPPLGEVDAAAGEVTSGDLQLVNSSDKAVEVKGSMTMPFWIDPGSMAVATDCGMAEFALPRLIVKGLSDGAYQVLVDGQQATQATDDQLAAGIALPSQRGKRLHDLVALKENTFFAAWREVRLGMADLPATPKVVEALGAADDGHHANIHALAAKAVPVTIKIERLPSGANLALRKSYVSSDPNSYNWGIGGLTDGSWEGTSKTCFATGDSATFPKSVTIDLIEPVAISSVVLGVPAFGSTKTIQVAISEDGAAFADVGSVEFELRKEDRHTVKFSPAKARYVRLTYAQQHTQEVNYSPKFAFTSEVEVYGPEN